jgi:nitrite reductase (NAD(P)H)
MIIGLSFSIMESSVIRQMAVLYVFAAQAYKLKLIRSDRQYVSCPLHKRNFTLTKGDCLNDSEYQILAFEAREDPDRSGDIQLLLPSRDDLDAILGTEKWLVRQAQSEALGLNMATQIDIVGLHGGTTSEIAIDRQSGCGSNKLEW